MKFLFRDIAPYALNAVLNRCRLTLDTAMATLTANWWKISLGRDVRFFGRPIWQRHPTAKITVGDYCTFRSAEWSSSIGLNRRCFVSAGRDAKIKIGVHCGFSGTVISASDSIVIGDRVLCGGNCTLVDTDRHPLAPVARANNENAEAAPIVIGDDVFLGMNVVVLKGCTIGRETVVAANSVVTRSLPERVIAGGIPAKILKNMMNEN